MSLGLKESGVFIGLEELGYELGMNGQVYPFENG